MYKSWPLGILQGLTTETGVYNTKPLGDYFVNFMKDHNDKFYRKWVMSSVDVESGDYRLYNEKSPTEAVKAALSSSAIPFVFPN